MEDVSATPAGRVVLNVVSMPSRGASKTVAKRPRYSRWRRLPGVFRSGEKRPDAQDDALDRIILYLPAKLLDLAESLAEKTGEPSVQQYCESLLKRALDQERVNQKVADVESKRGRLTGLDEIAADPDYLAEWQRRAATSGDRERATAVPPDSHGAGQIEDEPAPPVVVEIMSNQEDFPGLAQSGSAGESAYTTAGPGMAVTLPRGAIEAVGPRTIVVMNNNSSMAILAKHVGWAADDWGFLPCLRRGEAVPAAKSAELIWGLHQIEDELKGATTLDRRLAHALHRLALESQVLLTDLWPGAFDEPAIAVIRSVQEAVERILSGQDIRYYSNSRPDDAEPLP